MESSLSWVVEAPTEPGWYWTRDMVSRVVIPAQVGWAQGHTEPELRVFNLPGIGGAGARLLEIGGIEWYGPVVLPE